jgi:hypothetical protein
MRAVIFCVLALACSSEKADSSSGTGGGGGSAGSGGSGGSVGGTGGASGTSATGGSAGSGATGGGAGGSDAGAVCATRAGGALVTFQIVTETLTVWVTNSAFIDEALELKNAGEQRIPSFEDLLEGSDCDAQWSWHPDPGQVSFADFTIELCDGLPSHIEDDKTYWLGTVDSYCPWSAQVVDVVDRR